jgi:hypothetical protein
MATKPQMPQANDGRLSQSPRRTAGLWRWPWAAGAVLVWALAGPAPTQSCRVDWKLFDGTAAKLGPAICFFDASGVTRADGREVRVWTKCLAQREINAIAPTGPTGRAIAARNAQALMAGYVPPAASLYPLDNDGRMSVISYESAADLANLKPRSAIYYELNCARGTVRALPITAEAATEAGFRGAPNAFNPATPRGSGASLLQLLCGLNVAAQPPPALARRSESVQARARPAPSIHLAPALRQTREHIAEQTQRPRNGPRRPPATSRGASASSLDATLRPRLS